VAVGELQEGARASALVLREGALVVADAVVLEPLEGPLSEFLDLGALSFRPEQADSFRVDTPQRPVLWADRAPDAEARREDLESIWDPVTPPGWRFVHGAEVMADQATDLQLTFDRLQTVEVLPPRRDDPLAADLRWRLRAWLPGGRAHEVWFGTLAATGEPAVWEPADGKLLRIDGEILVTLRNLELALGRR
jgi:hypothetical protein